jgi:hypothetical protein
MKKLEETENKVERKRRRKKENRVFFLWLSICFLKKDGFFNELIIEFLMISRRPSRQSVEIRRVGKGVG